MGAAEATAAVDAAAAALPAWRATTAKDRGKILRRWHSLIEEEADALARIMTAEQGKPLAEARGEVAYGASFVDWFADEGRRIRGDVIEPPVKGRRIMAIRQPVGVVAAITPWNFPLSMITRKVAPALAAGCTAVLKPSEETPLCALALAELAQRAGVPDGVLNVVMGDAPAIGKAWCESPTVRKLTFTGSTAVGKLLARQCAGTVKRLGLELGGNAPFVVFGDADVELAAQGAARAKFRNAGQVCVAVQRILVHESVEPAFVAALVAAARALEVGPGTREGVGMGPMINAGAPARAEEHVADAVSRGATLECGGARAEGLGSPAFFLPTVLSGVDPASRAFAEETFGPVAAVATFRTEAEAVAMANDTEYGLAAYVYTRDISRAFRVSEALEYGMVGVNESIMSNEANPFGGVKESGLGREGSHLGIDEFLEVKSVTWRVDEDAQE